MATRAKKVSLWEAWVVLPKTLTHYRVGRYSTKQRAVGFARLYAKKKGASSYYVTSPTGRSTDFKVKGGS